jgi:hypothetical protein
MAGGPVPMAARAGVTLLAASPMRAADVSEPRVVMSIPGLETSFGAQSDIGPLPHEKSLG